MILRPANIAELSNFLSCANTRGEKTSSIDLSVLNRVLEHKAEDMTATVEAGMTLADFQKQLSALGQWLPIDPPHPEKLSISDLLSANLSGPRRFGYGTVGDYLIGIKVVLADGRVISPGGKVVKNVAGYDLAKLFIGGHNSLGIIAEATFKLRPLPEVEHFVAKKCESLDEADKSIESVLNSELTPVVLDLHNLSTLNPQFSTLLLGFAGTREEVEWQTAKARELGFNEPASLVYESRFWTEATPVHRSSVLPSKTIETIKACIASVPFVARAGNGIIYYRDDSEGRARHSVRAAGLQDTDGAHGVTRSTATLMQRLKNEFDPKNILPELPL
jgi:FAD/FMN-containing dehydrogenase